jgi:hypothetical protein
MQYCHIITLIILFLCICLISWSEVPYLRPLCDVVFHHVISHITLGKIIYYEPKTFEFPTSIWIPEVWWKQSSNFLIMTQWSTSLSDDDTPSTTVCTAPTTQVSHSVGTESVHQLEKCYTVPELYRIYTYSITLYAFRVGFVILTPWIDVQFDKMAVGGYKV